MQEQHMIIQPPVQSRTFPATPDKAPEFMQMVKKQGRKKSYEVVELVGQENLKGYSILELDALCDELYTCIKTGISLSRNDRKSLVAYYNDAVRTVNKKAGFARFIFL